MGRQIKYGHLLHGGDYNPEQWLDRPDILEKDIEYFKKAKINTVSVGMFSWAMLEPEEGNYQFDWLEKVIDSLYAEGISTILSTPSGARPKWLSDKYPEVLRVNEKREKNLFGGRHNHCYTSPVYREKVAEIDRRLGEKFGKHPGVILWHISNEFGGECHCPLCQEKFREWLEKKYGMIENLNSRWCTTFWSHRYQNFSQIESPSSLGENELHALKLDWKRFVTEQTVDFMKAEITALRETGTEIPVTTNLMYDYDGLDYKKFREDVDIISWDNYPGWHKKEEWLTATDAGMQHDLMRSIRKAPFLMMESCPSATNWKPINKLKKPGMLLAASLQAIAHGSDSVLYFQLRQSQGASEKFHGAVIDHYGGNDTRVFKEVSRVGETLKEIRELAGTTVNSSVAMLYDWDSQWAMEDSQGPRNKGLHYLEAMLKFYRGFRKQGVNVDVIDMTCELDKYKVLALPMVYMFKEGFAKKVRAFVENGGTLITSYWSGIADDTDRCYLEGTPHGLMDVLGIRSTEIDGLYDWEENSFVPVAGNELGLDKTYTCKYLCDLVELRGARTLMTYGSDFYEGYSCLTVNEYGRGKAWYVAADADKEFYGDFLEKVLKDSGVSCGIKEEIPDALEITVRENENEKYYIYQNFGTEAVNIPVPEGQISWIYGNGSDKLKVYGLVVAKVIV